MAGSIRKRAWRTRSGEIRTAWLADYRDQNRQRHKRQFATKRAATDWLDGVRLEVKAGIHAPDAASITIAQAADIWLAHCENEGMERGTLRVYRQYVRLYIVNLLGPQKLSRLTTPLVVAMRDALLKQTSRQRTRKIISTVRLILAEMQCRGLVAQNVALLVHVKMSDRDVQPLALGIDVPSKAEVGAMLHCALGRNRVRLVVSAFTGVRASELRALLWEDVDLEQRIVHVRRRADWWGSLGPVKTRNGYRSIPLTPLVVNVLKEWRLFCRPPRAGQLDLVFPGRDGKVVSHSTVTTDFAEVQRRAGVVGANGAAKYAPHALRHFFASLGIEQGFAPKRLQELLGHGSIRMTYDIYGHWLGDIADDRARMAAAEAAVLGARLPSLE